MPANVVKRIALSSQQRNESAAVCYVLNYIPSYWLKGNLRTGYKLSRYYTVHSKANFRSVGRGNLPVPTTILKWPPKLLTRGPFD